MMYLIFFLIKNRKANISSINILSYLLYFSIITVSLHSILSRSFEFTFEKKFIDPPLEELIIGNDFIYVYCTDLKQYNLADISEPQLTYFDQKDP